MRVAVMTMARRLQLGLTCMLLLVSGVSAHSTSAPRASIEVVERVAAASPVDGQALVEAKPASLRIDSECSALEPSLSTSARSRLYLHVTRALLL